MRNFNNWLDSMRASINGYDYYVDFPKVYANVHAIKDELTKLSTLIGSKNINNDFKSTFICESAKLTALARVFVPNNYVHLIKFIEKM